MMQQNFIIIKHLFVNNLHDVTHKLKKKKKKKKKKL